MNELECEFLNASVEIGEHEAKEREAQRQRELEAAQKLAEAEKQRAEEQERTARQLRKRSIYLASAFAIAMVMALTAVFFGTQAQTASHLATSRELAAASITNLDVDPERSILLGLEALDTAYTIEAEDALHRAIQASRIQCVVQAHEPGSPLMLALSPDGSQFVTGAADGSVKTWDAATGEQLLRFDGFNAAYSPEGKRLAVVTPDGTVKMIELKTGKEIHFSSQIDAGLTVAFSPDGTRLVTVASNNTPKIWDSRTGKELMAFPGHTDLVGYAVFSPDGTRLLTASDDGTARVWDAITGEQLLNLANHPGLVWAARYGPDGRLIGTLSGNEAYIWDATSGKRLLALTGHKNEIYAVAFSPHGTRLATGGEDRKIKVWDVSSGKELLTLSGHTGAIYDVAFSPDGKQLISSSDDGTVRIWNVSPSRELVTLSVDHSSGQIAFNMGGTHLATTDETGAIKIWDARSGDELITLPDPGSEVKDLVFNREGTRIFTAGEDGKVKLWDTVTGAPLAARSGHTSSVNGIAITKDGKRLATASHDYKVKIWDISSGKISDTPLLTLQHSGRVFSVAFNADGTRLATGDQEGITRVWDTKTGEGIQVLRGHADFVTAIAFSPECVSPPEGSAERCGTRLATSSWDGMAKVWNASTGEEEFTLGSHTGAVTSIAYSSDGKRIATASRDGTAKLWNASTGEELLTFSGDGSGLSEVLFSPDGKLLATGGDSGVRVYLLQIDDLIAVAKTRVTRSLTTEECQKYMHLDKSACAPTTSIPTTTAIPPTDQGRVCQVTNTGGLYDHSFNETIFKGVQAASAQFEWDAKVLQSASTPDFEKNIGEFLRGDCDLIVGVFSMSDAIRAAAEKNPNQKFQMMDLPYDPPLKNVWTQLYATDQAAFLAGYTAASVTKTGKVGVFGGIDFPPVVEFMDGFALGVAYYNEKNGTNVEVLGWDIRKHEGLFVGDFCCAAEGRQMTQQLLGLGADIILPVAGTGVGAGALYAVKTHGNAYIIGVDTDWAVTDPEYADIILTSITKNFDVSVVFAVKAIVESRFGGDTHIGTLETGEVSLAPFYELDSLIPAKVKADLEQIKKDIIAGKIKTKP